MESTNWNRSSVGTGSRFPALVHNMGCPSWHWLCFVLCFYLNWISCSAFKQPTLLLAIWRCPFSAIVGRCDGREEEEVHMTMVTWPPGKNSTYSRGRCGATFHRNTFFLSSDQWIFTRLSFKAKYGPLTKESLKKRFKSAEPDLIQPSRQTLSAVSLAFATTSGPSMSKYVSSGVVAKSSEISLQRGCWRALKLISKILKSILEHTMRRPPRELCGIWSRSTGFLASTSSHHDRNSRSALLGAARDGRLLNPRVCVEGARQSINHRVDPHKLAKQFAKK